MPPPPTPAQSAELQAGGDLGPQEVEFYNDMEEVLLDKSCLSRPPLDAEQVAQDGLVGGVDGVLT